ncbi:hypothetical protein XAP412_340044 [Xanthomonas phaseoli pv. phaseoli]|uniref:Uncharacterized protein n=1 Tax=Xanthomonas campestris pv. phaseoli TaxID=317013 RepID=A0AB38DZU6_XANCH|nr:hypothetical protein XAP6984_400045 [Xanthomonas phaseoli pv. phaseoli]SON84361.1 hypothetical protein XAP412_340044 [Xanthomonas phaseoli pv. phaseoli]SON88760.1 hypothetical protein XAP7430_390045 [Xanthomonas phaseoli pv. phaseoli]
MHGALNNSRVVDRALVAHYTSPSGQAGLPGCLSFWAEEMPSPAGCAAISSTSGISGQVSQRPCPSLF